MLQWVFGILVGGAIALIECRRGSLTAYGGVVAAAVGAIHIAAGLLSTALLLAFFFSSTALTRIGLAHKQALHVSDEGSEQSINLPRLKPQHEGASTKAPRGASQVLANSATACALCLGVSALEGGVQWTLHLGLDKTAALRCMYVALLAHYAACCADTWSSEVGMLARGSPVLITTMRPVPPGTNGGVSLLGTAAGAAGGALMGLVAGLSTIAAGFAAHGGGRPPPLSTALLHLHASGKHRASHAAWTLMTSHSHVDKFLRAYGVRPPSRDMPAVSDDVAWLWLLGALVALGGGIGLFGTLLDSVLGATLQYSGWHEERKVVVSQPGPGVKDVAGVRLMNNDAVNFVSSFVAAAGAALLAYVL